MKNNLIIYLVFSCTIAFGQPQSLKNGFFIEYYKNGNKKNKLYYKDGKMFGIAQMFNEQGALAEAGYWHINRWVGNYYLYYPNGQVEQEFNFDINGKRTGIQKYFYPNGVINKVCFFIQGKPDGPYYVFDSLGNFLSKHKEVYDSISKNNRLTYTNESFPGDSTLLDYVKNENLNVFRVRNLQKAETEAKLSAKKLELEKQKNFIYLVLSSVFGLMLIVIIFSYIQVRRSKIKIEMQNRTIEEKQKEILDSITYASRIQRALITSDYYIAAQLRRLMKKE